MAIQEGNERMRRTLPKEENAVTHVIEFTIALTVFVLLIQAFTSSMNHRIGIDLDINDDKVVMAREAISELAGSCLLYTSPSPRDLSTSRMPSSA